MRYRHLAGLWLFVGLMAGCASSDFSDVVDALDPREWLEKTFTGGDDEAKPPPGEDKEAPALDSVEKKDPPALKTKEKQTQKALKSDRDSALATSSSSSRQSSGNFPGPILAATIHFGYGDSKLGSQDIQVLRQVVKLIRSARPERIEIVGHASSLSLDKIYDTEAKDPKALSVRRARVVMQTLRRNGVARKMMQARGEGTAVPRYDDTDANSAAANRRVEIFFYDYKKPLG